eukprot:TRINITY_DN7870_c1_g1_i1.p1 TRINITY_DN7870_c1_g1~~TRINITY_DN7870_c1_g1_i1.p1  ORF type:complete len:498 (+),score=7.24 TRINITY_DN7870_c1_g1_i1:994-2487(+)
MWKIFNGASTPNEVQDIRNANIAYFLFFLFFAIVTILFMSNLLTAVVYSGYEKESKEEIKEERQIVQDIITKAWDILDIDKSGYLTANQVTYLLHQMRTYWQFIRLLNPETFNLLFWVMDSDSDGRVQLQEFSQILTILRMKFSLFSNVKFVHVWFPKFSKSKLYQQMCQIVSPDGYLTTTTTFEVVVCMVLTSLTFISIANVILVVVRQYVSPIVILFEVFVFVIFFVEAALRMLVLGWKQYWSERKLDFFMLLLQFIPCIMILINIKQELFPTHLSPQNNIQFLVTYFFVLPIPIFLRLLHSLVQLVPIIHNVIYSLVYMIRASYKLIYVLFSSIYILSVLGIQLFGEVHLSEEGDLLTPMVSMTSAFMFFTDVLYQNQITNSGFQYREIYDTATVWIFFILAQLLIVYICLNLVVSYTIQIFMAEMERRSNDYGEGQRLQFVGSNVYFSSELVPENNLKEVDTVRASLQGYLSAEIDKTETIRTVFERKMQSVY